MKVYEVGLVCEIDRCGRSMLFAANDAFINAARACLVACVDNYLKIAEANLVDGDEYERQEAATNKLEAENAIELLCKATTIDEMSAISLDNHMLIVRIYEREVMGVMFND
ncbi:hypothetical protein BTW00_05415 [Psychrobacter sp. C 20.9]|uniref:hypothetical protein n=1 Tax=Psychrobacter sp. C 20.9 TaxID=1926477 RepID=UPI000946CC01|nr:hypothetical protein [Psychrobacter sp. C 20.9]OLF36527.1 hypothetical protein BTW00_05415 [Psychrobacter sp. C 20.9]